MAVQAEKSPGQGQSDGLSARQFSDPDWAWAEYRPDAQRPWNLVRAGHLYRRAAFGADWNELQQALSDGPQTSIDKLLSPPADTAAFNLACDKYENATGSVNALRAWWLRRMIQTPHPLLEKMTLFWHSHFGATGARAKDARLMRRHVQSLRSHALGSFRAMLQGVSRDPAVLISLGADANRKALVNENFARALMETFTLGSANYTEEDIREAARAFTGWFTMSGRLRYIPREHDGSRKRILGQEGNFTGDDVVRIVLEQPATARMLVRKLYRWLISETEEPKAELIDPLAESFAEDYNILKLVAAILRSNLFFSASAYRRRIKCPAEFAVGIARALEAMVSTTQLAQDVADLGQNLYHPPTATGWTGERHWINDATMAGRSNLALALLRGSGPYGDKLDPRAVAEKHGSSTPESARQFLLDLFLQDDLDSDVRDALLKTMEAPTGTGGSDPAGMLRRFAHAVFTLPEFHLA
ncbi:MAG: DUF1800 domain-containing protein [Phycisphaerales bacterium]|nr:MAG: DUF1800 domain-containing protein [Phycisphaerales bacterium]